MFREDRGRKNLNTQERASIIAFLECEKTVTWISAKMGVSLSTVSYWKKRHEETGDVRRKDGSGKTKKITQEDEENIVSAALAKPITTAQEIAGIVYNEKLL